MERVVLDSGKKEIQKISYIGVVCDLFHYGHLQAIEFSKSISDELVCGVFTDECVEEYRLRPIANFEERKAVVSSLKCVDRIMIQHKRDPTENIKKIHLEFPEAKMILVHGDYIKDIPGEEYVKSIGGEVIRHPYYSRLSTFKIVNQIIENKERYKDIKHFTSYIQKDGHVEESNGKDKTIISSKADTLKALKPILKKSVIEPLYSFTYSDWKNNQDGIIDEVQNLFSGNIVVRSSAINEDTLDNSMAGYFESFLNVDANSKEEVSSAINDVLRSYKEKGSESSFNQVLIQKQTEHITISGVVFTRTLEKNSPYYVINYDDTSGSTDSVTAGRENKMMVISRFSESAPNKIKQLISSIKEIEEFIPKIPLDIEFAINNHKEVVIFQVRPLAANVFKENNDEIVGTKIEEMKQKFKLLAQKQDHLEGETTFFADMPDWNPAEIIGNNPNHLDYSLYDYIITNSAWHQARTSQGYYNVNPAKLVELFSSKPFVNVRNTFNSFTPAGISKDLRKKLVDYYLKKLKDNPHLQDKVEFEVLHTCYDLCFTLKAEELKKAGFSEAEIEELKHSLIKLTNNLVYGSQKSIQNDLNDVFSLKEKRKKIQGKSKTECKPHDLIEDAKILLDECRLKGTVQFSRLARLGFIAKTLLKALVRRRIISQNFYDGLYNSINTVATKINEDFKKLVSGSLSKEEFLQHYYHLRPGTYDITSLRYDTNPSLLQVNNMNLQQESAQKNFVPDYFVLSAITQALKEEELEFDAQHFIEFVKQATEARELAKFEFSKNLSDSLELIAKAGEEMGFTRKEVAMLDINDIFKTQSLEDPVKISAVWKELIEQKTKEREINDKIVLPSVIFSEEDFDVIEHYQAKPNFITQKTIKSRIVNIDSMEKTDIPEIEGNIVVLENGDPGYDWIFTRNPAGLITKYGGVASHMSIRCAEFGIPAAIGCGEVIFNKIINAEEAIIDCKNNKIITSEFSQLRKC